jgi:hypothetical protein
VTAATPNTPEVRAALALPTKDRGELGEETYRLDYWTECSRCENRDGEPTVVVPLAA